MKRKNIYIFLIVSAVVLVAILVAILLLARKKPKLGCGPGGCSQHGTCTNGVCVCNLGWSGRDCGTVFKKCPVTCVNGTCDTSKGECSCDRGWTGTDCNTPPPKICSPACVHGKCDTKGKCSCDRGWTSADCNTKICPGGGNCSGHGKCIDGQCQCDTGWDLPDCSSCTTGRVPPDCKKPPPVKPIPEFFLGGWLQQSDNFKELTEGKCYNLIYKNQPKGVFDATSGLGGYKDDIAKWRADGNIFIISRNYGGASSPDDMCALFKNPTRSGDDYDQKGWAAKFKDGDVKVDGFMFDYEPPHVEKNTSYLTCMENFLKYLNDNPDVYCGEKNIIFFSFSVAFISEGQPGAKSAIKRLGKMITDNTRLNVFYEFQKYQENKNFGKVVSSFKNDYKSILSNSVLITDPTSFVDENNGSVSKLASAMKNVETQGLRGLTFWWISKTLPGLDGHLPQDLIDAGKKLC